MNRPDKHLTAADFEPTPMWAADPHCPFCGKQFCVAPALDRFGRTLNICLACNAKWEVRA